MLTKNDFSASDWSVLRETSLLVGLAVTVAGRSGLGTLKESITAAQSIMEGSSSGVPLIRDLSNRTEVTAAQEALKSSLGTLGSDASAQKIADLALERVRSSIALLAGKATTEERQAYGVWLSTVAEKVAKAAKEGGFLGFGGVQVSEGEEAFLGRLNATLQDDLAAGVAS